MKKIFFFSLGILLFPVFVSAQMKSLTVPFTPQAPDGVWVEPWENACEETSVVMVGAYYAGASLSQKQAKSEINSILKTKNKNEGVSKDESPEKIVRLVKKIGKWDAKVAEDIDLEMIKKEIDEKHPVIFPFNAQKVNRYSLRTQVEYHVVVLVGYDDEKKEFIVNDPGSGQGENIRYSYDELLEANKNFTIRDSAEVGGSQAVFTFPAEPGGEDIFHRIWSLIKELFV